MNIHLKIRRSLVVVAMLTALAMLMVMPVSAQAPDWKDPTFLLAWLKLQGIGVSLVVTLIWKYAPVLKDWSNRAIPFITLVGWVIAVLGGAISVVHAAALGDPIPVHHSWFDAVVVGVVNSTFAKFIWDAYLKPTVGSWLDSKLKRVPQTP